MVVSTETTEKSQNSFLKNFEKSVFEKLNLWKKKTEKGKMQSDTT